MHDDEPREASRAQLTHCCSARGALCVNHFGQRVDILETSSDFDTSEAVDGFSDTACHMKLAVKSECIRFQGAVLLIYFRGRA